MSRAAAPAPAQDGAARSRGRGAASLGEVGEEGWPCVGGGEHQGACASQKESLTPEAPEKCSPFRSPQASRDTLSNLQLCLINLISISSGN